MVYKATFCRVDITLLNIMDKSKNKKNSQYPKILKCHANRCNCCSYIKCNSYIRSTVNNRIFNISTNSDIT